MKSVSRPPRALHRALILGGIYVAVALRSAANEAVPGTSPGPIPPDRAPAAEQHFRERVWPLLESRCLSCHGPDKSKGHLRLDSREATLAGGDLGPSVVPGRPAESLLLQAVLHSKPDLEMPPKEKLSAVELAILERWIRDGAPWPLPAPALADAGSPEGGAERIGDAWSDARNPIARLFNGQRLDLWSLRPIRRPEPPPPPAGTPSLPNPVDRFIRARLVAEGLSPAPEAERRLLARRAAFDLTGLPPSPDALDAFLADRSPEAYERYVDRLLASPRYGEHQARLWLDVVRYSDSNGFDWDEFRPQAWRFRDYVVRAFNSDLPFDRFIREQLAGDELVDGAPRTAEAQDRLVATGYLRIGPQDNSASLFNEQARARADWLADLTETTGSAILGVTLACCRCHDHKYDPFSQADHYRLRAFFQPVKYGDDLALDLAPEQEAIRHQHAEVEARAKPFREERDALLATARKRVRDARLATFSEADRRVLAMAADPQSQDFKEQAAALEKKLEVSDGDARDAFTPPEKKRHQSLGETLDGILKGKLAFTRALLATDAAGAIPPTRLLFQGDVAAERDEIPPGILSALDPNPAEIPPATGGRTSGRRLALADWLVSPTNPLTARVAVNRAWQAFFGRGLVATPNDFGLAGARPTHPELLDWLASEFVAQGWSIKRLHRLLVTSATYRQDSRTGAEGAAAAHDPGNLLLARQNLRRLSAEQLRDALLAVAGSLQHRGGGPPAWPELPADILQANPAFLDDNAEKTKGWYPSPPDRRHVRSLFLVQKRTVRVPFLETFDQPENSVSCPQRNVSIVAPQALSLLNGPEAVQAARDFAIRLVAEVGRIPEAQVARAFALAFQRPPDATEAAAALRFLARTSLPEFCRALFNANEFAYLD